MNARRVGIIELLTDTRSAGWVDRAYAAVLTKQFASITPQAVAIWCRQLGHRVHYTTYYGQTDPKSLLPPDLDVLFVTSMAKPPLPRFPSDGVLRGSLFAIYGLGVRGLPEPRFAG